MQYVQESLSPGEKILKISHYHWIYIFRSVFSAMFFFVPAFVILFLGILYHYYDIFKLPPWMITKAASQLSIADYIRGFWFTNIVARAFAFVLIVVGLLQIGASMLVVATTEIAVTSKRVVLKHGLVARRVDQMRTDFIEGDDLNQTIMGRIFDYGEIKISGTGMESIQLPKWTTEPVAFRRAIQMARNMSVQQAEQSLQNVHTMPNGAPHASPPAKPIPQAINPTAPPLEPR
jgi:hypothetical protein